MLIELKIAAMKRFGAGAQHELARRAGLSEPTLSRIINGRRQASLEERRAIARALRKPQRHLFPEPEVRSDAA